MCFLVKYWVDKPAKYEAVTSRDMIVRYYNWNWTEAVQLCPCSPACGYTTVLQDTTLCCVNTTCLWMWYRLSLHTLLVKDCKIPDKYDFLLENYNKQYFFCFSLLFVHIKMTEICRYTTNYTDYYTWTLYLSKP